MRWEKDAEKALQRAGFAVVERDGVDDFHGWGVLLGRKARSGRGRWAVLSWAYCSGCGSYEEMSDSEREVAFDDKIEIFNTGDEARLTFTDRKAW